MQRLTPALTVVGILLLFACLPSANVAQLAAIESGSLLELPCPASPSDLGHEEPQSLGQWLYSAQEAESGKLELRLGNTEIDWPGSALASATERNEYRTEMRNSIVRHLRSFAGDHGLDTNFTVSQADSNAAGLSLRTELRDGALSLSVERGDQRIQVSRPWSVPTRQSLLPPLVAIALAIALRKPVPALLAGVLSGSVLVRAQAGAGLSGALGMGTVDVFTTHLWDEVIDGDRMRVVAFVVFMLAMVGVVTRAGGIQGLMDRIARLASSARRSQLATWLMGLVIFFDDYANTILVGTTMRPLTDRFKVAREKLAYIVDSTAAPVAGISILSTWIAFEVSTFSSQLPSVGLSSGDGYGVFLQTLPYRFYCIFTLFFVGLVTVSGRDFGPMLTAERRARTGAVLRKGAKPMVSEHATSLKPAAHVQPRSSVAVWPVLTFVIATLGMILHSGGAMEYWEAGTLFTIESLTQVLYDGSGFDPLMWGGLAGFVLALLLGFGVGLSFPQAMQASWSSLRSMGVGLAILYLAWAIGSLCGDLGTAGYLTSILSGTLDPIILPLVLFLLSSFVAFATGSSWSTMTILLPLVVGLAFRLGEGAEIGGHMMMVISIGAVLEGAIFGDHCSPISDTTVMSSIASASDHIDHVRTQTPYALVTMIVAMICGYLPAAIWGISPWISLLGGMGMLTLIMGVHGKRAEVDPLPSQA